MKIRILIPVVFAVSIAAAFVARAGDGPDRNQATSDSATNAPGPAGDVLREPVKTVLDHYLKIQQALADDSTNGVSAHATAISQAVKADKAKILFPEVAGAADEMAGAPDLAGVREAFKDLSQALIKYLSDKNAQTGKFDEAYCPMANAYWLQTNKDIANPYLGHSMPGCGQIKRDF